MNFFGGYFHQDWPDEASDTEGIVAIYLAQNPDAEGRSRLIDKIRKLAISYADDTCLETALGELGFCYSPSADGKTARAWLGEIASLIEGGVEAESPSQ